MRLKVEQIDLESVYKDIARIPEAHRLDYRTRRIPEARICKVVVGGKSVLLSLRGQQGHVNPSIHMDEMTRRALGLDVGSQADFEFRQVWWLGQFLWAWHATDPAYRIAARLGLLSVLLGLVGLFTGVISSICR